MIKKLKQEEMVKAKLYLAICGVMFAGGEYLLVTRLDMGIVDILLLAAFGVGCAGVMGFSLRIWEKKKDSQ